MLNFSHFLYTLWQFVTFFHTIKAGTDTFFSVVQLHRHQIMHTTIRIFVLLFFSLLACVILPSCIEDKVSTSPADQPAFSVDTLDMGTVFTGQPTTTRSFMVYNRHDKVMSIGSIAFRDNSSKTFRINVDGQSGTSFSGIEIRPNDSIYVFVEATVPEWGSWQPDSVTEILDFVTNGVTRSVVLTACGQDIERVRGMVVTSDTCWSADRPRQIFDSLVVAPGATLTLEPGVVLHFHDKSFMRVEGTLIAEGTALAPIDFGGDRTGNVVADISFEIMDSQWQGLIFATTSHGNRMSHTVVRNTVGGVRIDSLAGSSDPSLPALELVNCRLRNSAGYALEVRHANLHATGCEFAEASSGVLRLEGGSHLISHCTIANYYLFSALGGPALQLAHVKTDDLSDDSAAPLLQADITNTIIYGNGSDLSMGDLSDTGVYLRRCLLKSKGDDDEHFINCIWDTDPLYYTVREDYIFDYRLRDESPAIGKADPAYTPVWWAADFYGVSHPSPADLGAYTYVPAEKSLTK